jgi:hypothetical protein
MRTLYLRNVPDEVADRLERMAKHEGASVNAIAGLTGLLPQMLRRRRLPRVEIIVR